MFNLWCCSLSFTVAEEVLGLLDGLLDGLLAICELRLASPSAGVSVGIAMLLVKGPGFD